MLLSVSIPILYPMLGDGLMAWEGMLRELPVCLPSQPWAWPLGLPIKKPPFSVSHTGRHSDLTSCICGLWFSLGLSNLHGEKVLFVQVTANQGLRQTLHLWYTCPMTNHREPLFTQFMFYVEPLACFCLPLCISLPVNLAEDEEADLKLASAIVSSAHAKIK